jgi:hypothetical protein
MDQMVENTGVETTTAKVDAIAIDVPSPRTRLDPRTGKQQLFQPASFWLDHAQRRKASGQSVRQYCDEHGLALSTFRRWDSRSAGRTRVKKSGTEQGKDRMTAPAVSSGFLSVPIRASSASEGSSALPSSQVEVQTRSGVKVCLYGQAADRAIDAVMAELIGAR